MTIIVVIILIGAAAVAFLVRFFIALCKEQPSEKCHVIHILTRFNGLKQDENSWVSPRCDMLGRLAEPAIGVRSPTADLCRAPSETIPSSTFRRAR
jgi:hypothetical protein